jgi:hypothetical protein
MSSQVQVSETVKGTASDGTALTRSQRMLLEFLQENDASCPVCGYNVRALTRPVCPECKQELTLTVGAARLRMGWLFVAIAPGLFSGIAAFFVLIPLFGRAIFGDGMWMPAIMALDLFGWCSFAFAIVLASRRRIRFLAQSRSKQRWMAITIWLIHIAAFFFFLMVGPMFL